jgi:hypothetical protein
MNARAVLARMNHVQKSFPFKVVASGAVVVLAIAAFVSYLVLTRDPTAQATAPQPATAVTPEQPAGTPTGTTLTPEQMKQLEEAKSAIEGAQKILAGIATARHSTAVIAAAIAVIAGVWMVIIWLGVALTYLALTIIAGAIAYPMSLVPSLRSYATVLLGVVALAQAFTVLIALLKVVFSDNAVTEFLATLTQPVTSAGQRRQRSIPLPFDSSVRGIAYKTVTEALRMKISLVFIIVLIFVLAALPLLLDEQTPLRYRVQSFLQWGTGGSFWIIAVLTLLFGVASVAFEQRDRQIWQTMTKPVTSAQYILGKWLGLIGINAVLLAVCCTGIFLFTEYLRNQPAIGEGARGATAGRQITEDRLILESQVLQARIAVEPQVEFSADDPEFLRDVVGPYIEDGQKRDPEFGKDQATYDRVVNDLYKQITGAHRSVAPGEGKRFVFKGLRGAKSGNHLITLRYKIDAGSNSPDALYRLTFVFGGTPIPPQPVGLGLTHTVPLYPNVINDDGELVMEVYNAALYPQPDGKILVEPNPETCQFPKGGMEVSYPAGSFHMNFLRVAFILWVKLAFLAMLGVTAATFLSFPVACLVAFSVFLCAEGTGFLANSLEYYDAVDTGQKVVYWKVFIRGVGMAITAIFKTYADLKPTTRLVDGQLLGWGGVATGTAILAIWTLALYGVAVSIFRKRELATYSGQ